MFTVIVFILILSVLVFVHEMGHFVVARRAGVKVFEFGLGFPPRAFSFYKDKEGKWRKFLKGQDIAEVPGTLYSLNWIPLGGFVKIKGENGEEAEDKDSFGNKKIWKRISILSAGVIMNVILTAVLLSIGFMIGLPQIIDKENTKTLTVESAQIQIYSVEKDTPAHDAKIQAGDVIVSIQEQEFVDIEKLSDFINEKEGEEITLKIKRGDEEIEKKITPQKSEEIDRAVIGVGLMKTGLVSYPWYQAIYKGVSTTIELTGFIVSAFYNIIKDLIIGVEVETDIAGPIGIAVLTGQVVKLGFIYVLQFTALLSLNLAIINFLPIPALDGGRVIFLIFEKLRGKPISARIENIIHNTGFALLMFLVLVVTFYDLSKFKDSFIALWGKIIGLF
ncbi:RIP metalloprotease RseP [Candidatus Falkowbacteria bacterium]|jgi:regulator of sigma E protease|nr:RIP metalloprotease RseP [Candidatus Falkowbacteria bacterium]MBT4433295.1 RIP metalloprotease RseP [Candidatus Falkowbacteria bacterium]